ncbi:MAG: NAD-binding protein, partial [Trebonia sp.]
ATGFALALLAKDVSIAAGLADDLEMDAPTLRLVNERWQQAADGVAPGTDHSAAHVQWWPEAAPRVR